MAGKTCIMVYGPTAVGKTAYAIDLALKYETSIISADSRQCFKELNIGVAKPSAAELSTVPHYFINSHSIREKVDVKIFEEYALNAVNQIFETNDVAIMVGGTGLYIKAFSEGLDDIPTPDEVIMHNVNENYAARGLSWLQNELEMLDPVFYEKGEMHNPQRMIRALAVKLSTGRSIAAFQTGIKVKRPFEIQPVYLNIPREDLYARINNRVDKMVENGLLAEVEMLRTFQQLNALQTIGYKEIFDFLDGKYSLEHAVENIKKNTRHFAKRQITWFNKFLKENDNYKNQID
ncbi:MAG: tRNA (adenosine(37)-N6)-dimethylallyltransferase MiaA [Ginsengibacter sp.]